MIWNEKIMKVETKWGTMVHKDGTVNVITTYSFPPECLKEAWEFKNINSLDASVHIRKKIFEDEIVSIDVASDEFRRIEEHPIYDGGEEE
tara:strand:- start:2421 stop:2690 length:270 start_codon:yes stop_codon:yes gene_type:complete